MHMIDISSEAAQLVPIGEHPEFRPASEKVSRLRRERDAMKVELRTLEAQIYEQRENPEREIDRLAAAAMSDDPEEAVCTSEEMASRAAILTARIAGHTKALTTMAANLKELRSELSVAPANAMLRPHRAAVGKMLKAFLLMQEAVAEERAVRRALVDAGYDNRLREMQPPFPVAPQHGYNVAPWEQNARAYVL